MDDSDYIPQCCNDEQDVKKICLECLEKKINELQHTFEKIRGGKVKSRRHDDFMKGGKSKKGLNFQCFSTHVFTEEQCDFALAWLKRWFCKTGDHRQLDYTLSVLQEELFLQVYADAKSINLEEAEVEMTKCVLAFSE